MSEEKERKIEGRWWLEGKDGPAHFGILTSSQSKLQLVVKVPQNLTVNEMLFQSIQNTSAIRDAVVLPEIIIGRNVHNRPVSIFGFPGAWQSTVGLRTLEIQVVAAINGLELSAWADPAIQAISIQIDPVTDWIGGQRLISRTLADGAPGFSLPEAVDVTFPIRAGVDFRILQSTGISLESDRTSFTQKSSVWLQFDEPRSLEEVSNKWIPWVNRLFSLLLGTGIRASSITCYREKLFGERSRLSADEGELLLGESRLTSESKEINPLRIITRYSELKTNFGSIVKKWWEVGERYETLIDLFAVVAFERSLHLETEFLFLVQALEVYHARCPLFVSRQLSPEDHKLRVAQVVASTPVSLKEWVERTLKGANNKHLDQRLTEIFSHHSSESSQIFGSDPSLPETIRRTRNSLTHPTARKITPKLLEGAELLRVSRNLRTFIWACLLKEIRVPRASINQLIRNEGNVR